jgi:hypothetical protein
MYAHKIYRHYMKNIRIQRTDIWKNAHKIYIYMRDLRMQYPDILQGFR